MHENHTETGRGGGGGGVGTSMVPTSTVALRMRYNKSMVHALSCNFKFYLSRLAGPRHPFHPVPASKNSLLPYRVEFFSRVLVPPVTACSWLLGHAQALDK